VIAKLKGLVDSVDTDSAVIDVGGVGYLVSASARTLRDLAVGGPATMLVETIVREDAIALYGFLTALELDVFDRLTTVQGVGARVALSILSTLSPDEIARAIAAGPKYLAMDEPSAGLNLSETQHLATLIKSIAADGVTILVVDHKIDFLRGICNRMMVLQLGEVIADGTPDEVFTNPAVVDAYLGV